MEFEITFAMQKFRACSSSGRASALQAEGKEFDSPQVQFSVKELTDNWASPCSH